MHNEISTRRINDAIHEESVIKKLNIAYIEIHTLPSNKAQETLVPRIFTF